MTRCFLAEAGLVVALAASLNTLLSAPRHREILARKEELGTLLAREEGKTKAEGIGEAGRAGQIFKFFAGEALRIPGEKLASTRPGVDVDVLEAELLVQDPHHADRDGEPRLTGEGPDDRVEDVDDLDVHAARALDPD